MLSHHPEEQLVVSKVEPRDVLSCRAQRDIARALMRSLTAFGMTEEVRDDGRLSGMDSKF